MTDAFDALRADTTPIDPNPDYAARLRSTLVAQLEEPMSNATLTPEISVVNTVTPYLVVDGAAAAIDFYVAAFGAVEHHRLVGDDGRVGHAEIVIGTSRLMLADEYPEVDAISPTTRGGTSTSFTVTVPDVDAVFARALTLGARELRPVDDQFYGERQGTLRDAWGHTWSISSPIAGFDDATYAANSAAEGFQVQPGSSTEEQSHDHQLKHYDQGDLYYFTLPTPDLAKAQAFYGAVLGWQFPDPGNGHVGNISAPPGSASGAEAGVTDLYFVVDDIHAAVAVVRSHGGTADEPVHYDSGWAATCTDDQGVRFH
ncbi:MAG: VOC family protein, partial [Actinomycetota bacterium]|nr:VOC family protein [Actinomycetota bacterium]